MRKNEKRPGKPLTKLERVCGFKTTRLICPSDIYIRPVVNFEYIIFNIDRREENISESGGDVKIPELLRCDKAVPVTVEYFEGVSRILISIRSSRKENSFALKCIFHHTLFEHHLNELIEVDGAVCVLVHIPNHVPEVLIRGGETVRPHHLLQIQFYVLFPYLSCLQVIRRGIPLP